MMSTLPEPDPADPVVRVEPVEPVTPAPDPPKDNINLTPPTNWRSILANIIIVIVAVATALPEEWGATGNPPVWLSSSQVVLVTAVLQSLLRIPVIANWLHDNKTVDETKPYPKH